MTISADVEPKDIDAAKNFSLSGYKSCGVRASFKGKDGGFYATSYSFSMSDEAKHYAAVRIALLLTMASGLTNDEISQMILKQRQDKPMTKEQSKYINTKELKFV